VTLNPAQLAKLRQLAAKLRTAGDRAELEARRSMPHVGAGDHYAWAYGWLESEAKTIGLDLAAELDEIEKGGV